MYYIFQLASSISDSIGQVKPNRKPTVVIAVGGNALASVRTQSKGRIADTPPILGVAAAAVRFAVGSRVLIVHGNGPQVGAEWLRPPNTEPTTLAEAVAKTQAGIGLELVSAIDRSLREQGLDIRTTVVLTRVVTSMPETGQPLKKPIGHFLNDKELVEAQTLRRNLGLEEGYGWRLVVDSPRPLQVLELEAIVTLLDAGHIVVAGGGGGVPLTVDSDGFMKPVEAVIDKDWTAALLANELDAALLLVLSEAPGLALHFGTEREEWLERIDLARLRSLLEDQDQFEQGSIRPKLEAVLYFLSSGSRGSGREALITDIAHIEQAVHGRAGTRLLQ
jgi:carbamate kinase